jgi:hypothetical protein
MLPYPYVEREGAESTRVTTFLGFEGILRELKPGLLRFCNDQRSRFISTQGRLAFDSPTVLVNAETGQVLL